MSEYQIMSNNHSSNSNSYKNTSALKDPFYVVKDKVNEIITQITEDFEQWKKLLEQTNTAATDSEFPQLTQNIKMNIKKVKIDIADLSQTVQIVTDNRLRFKDISDAELANRRTFVNDMKAIIDDCEETLISDRTLRKIDNDKRKALFHVEGESPGGGESKALKQRQFEHDANDFLDNKQQEQMLLEKKQDIVLDDMSSALSRLGDVSTTISDELKLHKTKLEERDTEMNESQ